MRGFVSITALALAAGVHSQSTTSIASSCSSTLSSKATPSVAPGYVARLVANQLSSPRGIIFDSDDNLLVVEAETAITALRINDDGDGCLSSPSRKTVVEDNSLNHGITLSFDGNTLYASSPEAAYSWDYSAGSQSTSGDSTTLVTNMTNSDHTTRTLLLSRFAPGLLVVTRGSTSNIDVLAEDLATGHSQIKAFNLSNMTTAYDFNADGLLLGWGLRNDVGIAEEPIMGGIYSVENSVDQMHRDGVDIHETNPSEELNFLGYLNGTASSNQGRNFGYPECYTAWDIDTIPHFNGEVGQQFAIGTLNGTYNDSFCSESERQAARLGFHPHMAPLDILFNENGTTAWITFHGSWNSDPPVGYKLSMVAFENGEPVEPSTSNTAAIDILSNEDVANCGDDNCFRPVGLAWDSKGRLFMSSDTTGEIYAILQDNGEPTSSAAASNGTGGTGSTPASAGGSASSSSTGLAAGPTGMSGLAIAAGVLAYLM